MEKIDDCQGGDRVARKRERIIGAGEIPERESDAPMLSGCFPRGWITRGEAARVVLQNRRNEINEEAEDANDQNPS